MENQSNIDELRVLTLNTWGLLYISQDLEKRMNAIGDALSKGSYDLVFLQEVWSVHHYNLICDKVQSVLPHSHYFRSGFLGSGCATFSKYPILNTLFHKYSVNGYFWDIFHCDWYAGRGVAYATVAHPNGVIHSFNTHIHADDPEQKNCVGVNEMRTLQCYQIGQLVNTMTRPGDAVIVCGDMNHLPDSLGIKAISSLAPVKDTYEISPSRPAECYTVNKEFNKYLPEKEITSRIDYIFVSNVFECIECDLAMRKVPNSDLHFSDHEGYSATILFSRTVKPLELSSGENEFSGVELNDETITTLRSLRDVMREGERVSDQINLTKAIPIFTSFFLFAILPLFTSEKFSIFSSLFASVLPSPLQNLELHRVLHGILCVTSSVVMSVYSWVMVVIRRVDVNEFRAASEHIQTKINRLQKIQTGKVES